MEYPELAEPFTAYQLHDTNKPCLNVPAEGVHQLDRIETKTTLEGDERLWSRRLERDVWIDSPHENENGSESPVLVCSAE